MGGGIISESGGGFPRNQHLTLAADRWREDYRIDGLDGLKLHHL